MREVKGQPGMIEPEHGRVKGAVIDTLQAAREDYDAVVKLTRDLVRIFPAAGGSTPTSRCWRAWQPGWPSTACRAVG